MSALPADTVAVPTRPRWTPVVLDGDRAPVRGGAGPAVTPADAAGPTDTVAGTDAVRVRRLAPASRAVAWRRRAVAIATLVVLTFLLTVAIGRVTAGADLADPVAGTHTLAPGETLWQVAAATAPDGTDTRDQLARIVALNGFDQRDVQAWTVVLLPAR